ncbi:MAG: mechanosensitive ion channel [Synergistaceae bacterium]|nr:mechanosensitive ion channel [Synergistaceae bacterium]
MFKKSLLALVLIVSVPSLLFGAENQEIATDYVTQIQHEISADISKLRASLETELKDMKLDSTDIAKRSQELEQMSITVSEDMAAWEYTPEQRQLHTHILSDLITAYSTYGSLLQAAASQTTESDDVSSLGIIVSPDINESDAIRLEIQKVSRGLDVQVFYLQSKISKLRLDLAEAASLEKQLKAAQDGGEALVLPHTHVLSLENAKINAALTSFQVRSLRATFEANIKSILRLRRRLADINGKVSFSKELLEGNIKALNTRLTELSTEMANATKSLHSSNSSLKHARALLTSADTNTLTVHSSSYRARSIRANYWEYMTALINDESALIRETQEIWRKRYKMFHDEASGEEIWSYRESAERRQQELQKQLESIRVMENVVFKEIETLQAQAKTEGLPGIIHQNLMQAAENRRRMISDVFNRYENIIPLAIFYQQRLRSEANDNLGAIRLAEKVSDFSKETVLNFLATELWQGDGYSVTVSKLIIAIAVFVSSFFLSTLGSHWIKRRMLGRFKASVTAANAVQRIVFYILWIAFALIALNIVKIPLTAFAFMGGAIALGIGVGMQNIFNNLISGFIVIFSRPFKVNDIIEVAGTQGVVDDIGSRATTIRTWDGLDVVLPNRYFLENGVTNWTKADMRKREVLKVGVSYDADSREVEKILLDIVNEHSQTLKNPAPLVIFRNFGDNALEFEIYYWIELKKSSGMKVSSDLRHHIAAVFKREGIEIPFPQSVIHIDSGEAREIGEIQETNEAENVKL